MSDQINDVAHLDTLQSTIDDLRVDRGRAVTDAVTGRR